MFSVSYLVTPSVYDWGTAATVQVLDPASMLTVRKVENVSTGANNKPRLTIVIQECGEL